MRIVLLVPLTLLTLVASTVESVHTLIAACALTAFLLGCSIESVFRVKFPLDLFARLRIATAPLSIALGVFQVIVFVPWAKTAAIVFAVAMLVGAGLARWKHSVDDAPGGGDFGNFYKNKAINFGCAS